MSKVIAIRNTLLLLALALPLLAVGGCNTTEGFGEDVQAGGRAIERTSERAR